MTAIRIKASLLGLSALTMLITAQYVMAQTCPCSFEPGRECTAYQFDPSSQTCTGFLVPCECFCDYSGNNNNGDCPLDLFTIYQYNASSNPPVCESQETFAPICAQGPAFTPLEPPTPSATPMVSVPSPTPVWTPPPSQGSSSPSPTPYWTPMGTASASPTPYWTPKSTPSASPSAECTLPAAPSPSPSPTPSGHNETCEYVCADMVQLAGVGSITCTVPALPCSNLVESRLSYWQFTNYSTKITFGNGMAYYTVDVNTRNKVSNSAWFGQFIPGTVINFDGSFQGPGSIERSFLGNSTSMVYGDMSYTQMLMDNCIDKMNQATSFDIFIDFTTANQGANFVDSGQYGIRTITKIVVQTVGSLMRKA